MTNGNPGAVRCLTEILKFGEEIDPQSGLGAFGPILMLDEWNIYDSSIYVLWNDQCNKDTRRLIMLIRAVQLGLYSHADLKRVAADQSRSEKIDLDVLDAQVCERLSQFKRPDEVLLSC